MSDQEKKKRGRPLLDKVARAYTIDRDKAKFVDSLPEGDRSKFVNQALEEAIKKELSS